MTTVAGLQSFDLTGELPRGVTVLEASAGTGKTFMIAGLTARHVAAGMPLHSLLLVTFTRVATGELRHRIRSRLDTTEQELTRMLTGASPAGDDAVIALLASGSRDEVVLRRERIRTALADFDAATIATTHGFCHEVLGELGTVGELEPGTAFVEDLSDLREEVLDDLYIQRFFRQGDPPFGHAQAMQIAAKALDTPLVPIEPAGAPADSAAAMRARLAARVREAFAVRKRSMGIMDYNDLLTRLSDALTGPYASAAVARLQARYRVVLVDEFQDTDPIQWEILRRGFADAGTTVVLIADPKQAIYAFRGADVYAYLEAAETATTKQTLDVNWRSDQGLIDAYDALFGNARLGHEGIVYRRVRAPAAHRKPRLTGAPVTEPLRIRLLRAGDPEVEGGEKGYILKDYAADLVAHDLATDVVALLSSKAQVEIRAEDGTVQEVRRLCPRDVGVLVRLHRHASLIQEALAEVHIPAVINGAGSVFETPAAHHWLRLLEAVERPSASTRARTASLTPFIGWSATRVACADESEREELHQRLHRWARVLRTRGVAALFETIAISENLAARMLALTNGERDLTDLRHVAELLHGAAVAERLGTTGLTAWLRSRIVEAGGEPEREERTRRLESDDEAVQVLTIHRSKGLEFPVVYCPFLWDATWIWTGEPVVFHDPEKGDRRTLDVGLDTPEFRGHESQYTVEQRGEDLRLMYVALTRAMHQAVIWWAPAYYSHHSPLARLVFFKDADGKVPAYGRWRLTDAQAKDRFEELAAGTDRCVSVEAVDLSKPGSPWVGRSRPVAELAVATFERELDLRWRRTSYSAIKAAAYDAWVASEPEDRSEIDEPDAPTPRPDGGRERPPPEFERISLWANLPVGVRFGSFVHRTMEATDFAAANLQEELEASVRSAAGSESMENGDAVQLVEALHATLDTPLGALLGDRRLRDIERADRLDELEFELPLVGGDSPSGSLTLAAIAQVLREHLAPADPLHGYVERLGDPELRSSMRGYLTGSIDLLLRIPGARGARFAIVDYKTNWLGAPDEKLLLWFYRPASLAREMVSSHYALQALLYLVAAHRYLRWRVNDYRPDQLVGVVYLFLRGMTGADTPLVDGQRCGVFPWRPPSALVEALSRVLDRGAIR